MALLLKNAHVVDPAAGLDGVLDVLIDGDRISAVGADLSADAAEVIDLSGKYLVPGLVDMHVHLREPGYEHKGDIESETAAAAAGGFTGVCSMPNTDPVADNGTVITYIKARAAEAGHCRVFPAGAMSKGLKREIISEMGDMVARGAVAFTDDGRGIQGAGMMRRCMDMSHCQDEDLVGDGQVNEGVASTRLGLLGWPAEGEELQISRDIMLAELTGAKLHIQHISTARGLDMVRAAKAKGLPVTCEAAPHHMFLTEDAITGAYETSLKVNPPLRTSQDAAAIVEGVLDGTVDAIVTDHAPHADWEKSREFELAPFGMIGIEASLALINTNLVKTGKILGLEPVSIAEGSLADITVFDADVEWTVGEDGYVSRAKNCGFAGTKVAGRATDVFVGGKQTLKNGAIC